MPANRNSIALELLSWHGHDKGGVRVPFGEFGEPLGRVIETRIGAKLREAAADIATAGAGPRWFFLVGGPGNGKSQMVEEFVRDLGSALSCEEELTGLVAAEFRRTPTPRKVEIGRGAGSDELGDRFAEAVSKLIIIQDASASDRSDRDAAELLNEDLTEVLTEPREDGAQVPVLVCCINRGLLAGTMMATNSSPGVMDLMEALSRATALGEEALQKDRSPCWPVEALLLAESFPAMKGMVACWPMDIESLIDGYDRGDTAAGTILAEAVSEDRWEVGGCGDCDYNQGCPLLQNARWLRAGDRSRGLLQILRRQGAGER